MARVSPAPAEQNIAPPFPAWSYVLCALVAFVVHFALSTRLYDMHVFQQYDVLFNADPNEGLVNLSHGWGTSEFKHPTLTYLFSPFAHVFGAAVKGLSLSASPLLVVREHFALFLLAAFSACRAVCFLEVCRFLGLAFRHAVVLSALAFFAFSSLMFGAIPDSFALSSTCIVIAYYLALKPAGNSDRTLFKTRVSRGMVAWAAVFFVGVGITITNVIALGLLLLLALTRRGAGSPQRRLLVAGVAAIAAVGINLGLAAVAQRVLPRQTTELAYLPTVDTYVHKPSAAVAVAISRAFGNGVLAGAPTTVPLRVSPGKTAWYTTAITYESGQPVPLLGRLGTLLVVLGVVGGVAGYYHTRQQLPVVWTSLAILASSIAIHMFFGDEYVLYSLHWHYSLMIIVAGVCMLPVGRLSRGLRLVAAVCIMLVAASNLFRIRSMVGLLGAAELREPVHMPERSKPVLSHMKLRP